MKTFIPFVLVIFSCTSAFATHLIGGHISSEKAPFNNDITITLTLYRDGSSTLPFPNTQNVKRVGGNTESLSLINSYYESSGCGDSIEVGIYRKTFYGNVGYSGATFTWTDCCRGSNIVNLDGASTYGLYLETTIMKNVASNITSNERTEFNNQNVFSFNSDSIVEIDFSLRLNNRDSIHYSLVSAKENGTTMVGYDSLYSYSKPFGINTISSLDSNTGRLTVYNPSIGHYVVAVKAKMYANGLYWGEIVRDVVVKINPPKSNDPQLNISFSNIVVKGGSFKQVNNDLYFEVYESAKITFDVNATGSHAIGGIPSNINLSAQGTGGYEDTCGIGTCYFIDGKQYGSFKGNLSGGTSAQGHFDIKYSQTLGQFRSRGEAQYQFEVSIKDSCGLKHAKTIYAIVNLKEPNINSNITEYRICEGDSIKPVINGAVSKLLWTPSTGVSNVNSASPWIKPTHNIDYEIYNLHDSSMVVISVKIDSLYPAFSIVPVGDSLKAPHNLKGETNLWYYNGVLVGKDSPSIFKYLDGKHWVKYHVNTCEFLSDTIYHDDPSLIHFFDLPKKSNEFIRDVGQIEFDLMSVGSKTNRINEVILPYTDASSKKELWKYTITDKLNNDSIIAQDTLSILHGNYVIEDLDLPLFQNASYHFTIKPFKSNYYQHWMGAFQTHYTEDKDQVVQLKAGRFIVDDTNPYLANRYPLINIRLASGIGVEENEQPLADLYPNPFKNKLIVDPYNEEIYFELYNLLGQIVLSLTLKERSEINTSGLANGSYIYVIKNKNKVQSGKLNH